MPTQSLSRVWLFAIPWTVAHWAPLSMELSRQEYCSGLPCPPPGELPDPIHLPSCQWKPTMEGLQMQPSLPPVLPLILSSRICPPLPPPRTQDPRKHCQDFFPQNPLSHTSPCCQCSSIPHSDSLLDEHEWVPSLSSFQLGHSYGPIHVLKQEIYLGPWGHQRLMHSFCLIPFPNSPSLSFPPISSSNKSALHIKKRKKNWKKPTLWGCIIKVIISCLKSLTLEGVKMTHVTAD